MKSFLIALMLVACLAIDNASAQSVLPQWVSRNPGTLVTTAWDSTLITSRDLQWVTFSVKIDSSAATDTLYIARQNDTLTTQIWRLTGASETLTMTTNAVKFLRLKFATGTGKVRLSAY